jgi:MFS family permease
MGNGASVSVLLAVFTVGIAVGSIVCERLSHHLIRPSLIVVGAIGMSVAGIDFALSVQDFHLNGLLYENPQFVRILVDLVAMGIFGGLYSVPLYALIQRYSVPEVRSRIIAANNVLNALFMVVGSVAVMLLLGEGWTIASVLLAIAIATAGVAVLAALAVRRMPHVR